MEAIIGFTGQQSAFWSGLSSGARTHEAGFAGLARAVNEASSELNRPNPPV